MNTCRDQAIPVMGHARQQAKTAGTGGMAASDHADCWRTDLRATP